MKSETEEELVLIDADANHVTILKEHIEGKKTGKSSMPEDLVDKLSASEIRDLVEYLSQRKTKVDPSQIVPKGH